MEEIKELKKTLHRYRNYLKTKTIRYFDENGYQETPYIEMNYDFRINDKGYNRLMAKMDKYAFELQKLLEA